jgi:hypothetical protein
MAQAFVDFFSGARPSESERSPVGESGGLKWFGPNDEMWPLVKEQPAHGSGELIGVRAPDAHQLIMTPLEYLRFLTRMETERREYGQVAEDAKQGKVDVIDLTRAICGVASRYEPNPNELDCNDLLRVLVAEWFHAFVAEKLSKYPKMLGSTVRAMFTRQVMAELRTEYREECCHDLSKLLKIPPFLCNVERFGRSFRPTCSIILDVFAEPLPQGAVVGHAVPLCVVSRISETTPRAFAAEIVHVVLAVASYDWIKALLDAFADMLPAVTSDTYKAVYGALLMLNTDAFLRMHFVQDELPYRLVAYELLSQYTVRSPFGFDERVLYGPLLTKAAKFSMSMFDPTITTFPRGFENVPICELFCGGDATSDVNEVAQTLLPVITQRAVAVGERLTMTPPRHLFHASRPVATAAPVLPSDRENATAHPDYVQPLPTVPHTLSGVQVDAICKHVTEENGPHAVIAQSHHIQRMQLVLALLGVESNRQRRAEALFVDGCPVAGKGNALATTNMRAGLVTLGFWMLCENIVDVAYYSPAFMLQFCNVVLRHTLEYANGTCDLGVMLAMYYGLARNVRRRYGDVVATKLNVDKMAELMSHSIHTTFNIRPEDVMARCNVHWKLM